MKASEVLDLAATVAASVHHIKGAGSRRDALNPEKVYGCCTYGALDIAARGGLDENGHVVHDVAYSRYNSSIQFIRDELFTRAHTHQVASWNDRLDTTKEDVVSLLQGAAIRARAAGF